MDSSCRIPNLRLWSQFGSVLAGRRLRLRTTVWRVGQDSVLLTYLDMWGRPVVTLAAENLVENHIQQLRLAYRWPLWMVVREPLMLVAAFLLLFLIVCVYVRLDFSITKVRRRSTVSGRFMVHQCYSCLGVWILVFKTM